MAASAGTQDFDGQIAHQQRLLSPQSGVDVLSLAMPKGQKTLGRRQMSRFAHKRVRASARRAESLFSLRKSTADG